ncbi:cysteine peptidase family C39 domain-containing protein [Mycoplasmoides genitalium]|uniref:cysteine peptidase family C39 domain-containing protein n=1 Tax=Mycoplasmoides genitalium TaxID=2097 RepID=UPI00027B419E|nr:peptidase domain-containing ABC transporter [Mycoplasmoides genitalium]AFQ03716.1 ABC transporter ATP-binding protein/permease [Mycoplasmoides genitalium M6282]
MKIIYQEQQNECGICVIGMLANAIHDEKYVHDELLEQINLPPNGLSLFEMESYGKKFGLEINSYQLTFQELKELDSKFIIVHFKDHFVIVKNKHENSWEVYDPAKGKYLLTDEKLEKLWTGYAATVAKAFKEIPPVNKSNFFSNFFDFNLVTFYVFIELIIIGISTLLATASRTIITNTVDFGTAVNLVVLVVYFSCLKGLNLLLQVILQLIRNFLFWKQYRGYLGWIIQSLQQKSFVYFSNKSPNQLIERQFYLKEVLSFFNFYIPNLIISCVVALIIGVLIGINQLEFLLIAIAQIVVNAGLFCYDFFFTKKITKKEIPYVELQNKISLQLDENLREEQNKKRFNFLMLNFRKALLQNQNINNQKEINRLTIENIKSFFQQGFDFAILGLGVIGIIEQRYQLSFLFYVFGIQSLFSTYATRIVQFGAAINIYHYCREKLVNLFIETKKDEGIKVNWQCPDEISLENLSVTLNQHVDLANLSLKIKNETVIFGQNGSGKSTFLKILTGRGFEYTGNIKFNNVDLKRYSKEQLFENVYYLKGQNLMQTEANDFGFSEALFNNQNPHIYQLLFDAGVQNQTKLSSGQKQILQLFLLSNIKNKVILLDECMNAIAPEIKNRVYQLLVKPLTLNNFVVLVEHDLSFASEAQNKINLTNYLRNS